MTRRTPIISARRTDSLEALLQRLWTLRPELEEKQATTVTLAVAALIREVERADQVSPSTSTTTSAASSDNTAQAQGHPAGVSDDVEW